MWVFSQFIRIFVICSTSCCFIAFKYRWEYKKSLKSERHSSKRQVWWFAYKNQEILLNLFFIKQKKRKIRFFSFLDIFSRILGSTFCNKLNKSNNNHRRHHNYQPNQWILNSLHSFSSISTINRTHQIIDPRDDQC